MDCGLQPSRSAGNGAGAQRRSPSRSLNTSSVRRRDTPPNGDRPAICYRLGSLAAAAIMDFDDFFRARVDALHAEGRYRVFADLERRCGRFPRAFDHRIGAEVTVWCSNDYLGMGQHPAVLAAMADELRGSGAGAGGTRNISGTSHAHVLLERELADLHGREAALVFTSGFVANEAALSTLAGSMPGMVVLSDQMNHASMIAGIRHSGAEKLIFRHNDPDDLARLLASLPAARPKLVCFESVYSMDGDIARTASFSTSREPFGPLPISTRCPPAVFLARPAAASA